MFSKLFSKMSTFADHHQAIIAALVTLSVICVSWGFEKILENFVFHKKTFTGYFIVVCTGLLMLWLIQHYVLHAI